MRKIKRVLLGMICLGSVLVFWMIFWEKEREAADVSRGWEIMLVNDDYYVPEEYEAEMTLLQNGEYVDSRMYPYLQDMFDAAKEDEIYMIVADGYRSKEEQQELMNERIEEYKKRYRFQFIAKYMAEKWVAVPGTSEHQLGLAVDINADIYNYGWEVYGWLANHAHEYGFIQRYPEDKEKITGISYEPWHYRYVGVKVATEIYEKGICLEEYIDSLE